MYAYKLYVYKKKSVVYLRIGIWHDLNAKDQISLQGIA